MRQPEETHCEATVFPAVFNTVGQTMLISTINASFSDEGDYTSESEGLTLLARQEGVNG